MDMLKVIKSLRCSFTNFSLFLKIILIALCYNCSSSTYANDIDNIRGKRYCEVIVAKNRWTLYVYNSFGLNDCPPKLWRKMTTEGIQKETHASWIKLNGPRYWLIDGFKSSSMLSNEHKVFGGLEMREAGVLHIGLSEMMKGAAPYLTHTVHRHTTYVFRANSRIYELINPQGKVFVMQSYSVQKHPQTEASLSNLGSQLKLPAGWKFKTGMLTSEKHLTAVDDKAIVIQDNYSNTYQEAPHDFL